MDLPRPLTTGSLFLDIVRGLAALLVAFSHARRLLILGAEQYGGQLNIAQKLFYFLTSLGPSCVVVFFVLSGFLVGSTVIRAIRADTFSWHSYLTARLTRIWIVLIPAVLIGFIIDQYGLHCFHNALIYTMPNYGGNTLPKDLPAQLSWHILVGNLFCLQDILVPQIGTNGPLWSLTYEVAYYLIFPLFAVCFMPQASRVKKVISFLSGLTLLAALPRAISLSFIVWLYGAAVALMPPARFPKFLAHVMTGLFVGTLMASTLKLFDSQFLTGVVTALLIYIWLCRANKKLCWNGFQLFSGLAAISYTLYLVHMPLLVFLTAFVLGSRPEMPPGPTGVAITIGFLAVVLIYATLFWYLFERQTPTLRRWVADFLFNKNRSNGATDGT